MHAAAMAWRSVNGCTTSSMAPAWNAGGQHQRRLDLRACMLDQQCAVDAPVPDRAARARGVDHDELRWPASAAVRAARRRRTRACGGRRAGVPSMCICSRAPMRTASAEIMRDAARAVAQHPARREFLRSAWSCRRRPDRRRRRRRPFRASGRSATGTVRATVASAKRRAAEKFRFGAESCASSELARSCEMPSCASSLSMAACTGERR